MGVRLHSRETAVKVILSRSRERLLLQRMSDAPVDNLAGSGSSSAGSKKQPPSLAIAGIGPREMTSSPISAKQQPPSLAIAGIGPPKPVLLGAGTERTPNKKVRIDETRSEIFELQPIDMDLTRDAT